MSSRAAWRLQSLGFRDVYRYREGKMDWLASGLPWEGASAASPRASDAASRDVPTCGFQETVAAAVSRLESSGWNLCVVLNEGSVVLGLLRGEALRKTAPHTLVEAVMEPGPSTFRPHRSLEEMAGYMEEHRMNEAIITNSDGQLIGVLRLKEARRLRTLNREAAESPRSS